MLKDYFKIFASKAELEKLSERITNLTTNSNGAWQMTREEIQRIHIVMQALFPGGAAKPDVSLQMRTAAIEIALRNTPDPIAAIPLARSIYSFINGEDSKEPMSETRH